MEIELLKHLPENLVSSVAVFLIIGYGVMKMVKSGIDLFKPETAHRCPDHDKVIEDYKRSSLGIVELRSEIKHLSDTIRELKDSLHADWAEAWGRLRNVETSAAVIEGKIHNGHR